MSKKLSVDLSLNATAYKQGTNEVIVQTNKLSASTKDYIETAGSLRKQFMTARREAQNLAAQYNDLSKAEKQSEIGKEIRENMQFAIERAGELQDVMSDTQQAIKNAASDTRGWDGLKEGMDAVGDATVSVMGTIAAMTGDQKDLNKALGAYMAIEKGLAGVIKVVNMLQAQSKVMKAIDLVQTKALTVAQSLQTKQTWLGVAAQKTFNLVANANPYVLLATAILTVCGAIGTYIALTHKSAQEQIYEEEMLDTKKRALEAYNDTFTKSYADGIAGYRELENAWKQMKGTHQETEWIKKCANKFNEYGANVKTAADVDKFFAQQGKNVIESLRKRAIAEAQVARAKELYTKSVELQMKAEAKQAEARAMAAMDQARFMQLSANPVQNIVEIFNLGDAVKKRQEAMVNEVKNIAATYTAMSSQFKRLGDNMMAKVDWGDFNWGKFEPDTSDFKKVKDKAKKEGKEVAKTYKEELENNIKELEKQLNSLKPTPENEERKIQIQADIEEAKKQLEDFQIWTGEKTIPLKFSDDWFNEQMQLAKKLQSAVELGTDEWQKLNNRIAELNGKHIQIMAEINKDEIQKSINEIIDNGVKPIELKIKKQHDFSLLDDDARQEADGIIQKISQLEQAYKELEKVKNESKDTITTDAATKGLETLQTEINNTTELLTPYIEKQKEAEENEAAREKIEMRADAWGSYSEMIGGAAQALSALGDEEGAQIAQFAMNTAAMLADMVSRIMALQAETMAEGAASVFDLPFPANIAAWATVAATIGSIFASLPKFAEGGVVGGGSYSGDKILARLNSGEGVLTKQGLRNLTDIANRGPEVQAIALTSVRVKGSDIYLSQENYKKINHIK